MGFGSRGRRAALAASVGLLVLSALACASRPISPPPPDPMPLGRDDYVIGMADILRVAVWRNPELTVEVPVRSDGKISVPLLDDVQAAGLTALELKEVLTRELAEYITAPDVTVVVTQMNSCVFSIVGEVARNAQIPLTRDLRVLEAIAVVGGFRTFANKSKVRIVRGQSDGTEVEYRFNYDAYIKGDAPGSNILLRCGDAVIVPD